MKEQIKDTLIIVGFIWLVWLVDFLLPFINLNQYGIEPRTLHGLIGILFAPFLHANIFHLISNTVPLTVLLFILIKFYEKQAIIVIFLSIILGGTLVWLFGRSAIHVGASGLIYSLAAFNVVFGFLQKKFVNIAISLLVVFLYGGLIWGIFPTWYFISWEGHLFGAVVGVLLAFILNKNKSIDEKV